MDQDFMNGIKPEMLPLFRASFLFAYCAYIVIYSLYIRNLYKLLHQVSPANRRLQPSRVFLLAIGFLNILSAAPLFIRKNLAVQYEGIIQWTQVGIMMFLLIFTFYMVNKIAESLDAELKSRNIHNDPKPTLNIGMFMCICNTAALLIGVAYLAAFGAIASVMGFVAWIMYWLKTREYRLRLESPRGND